MTRSFRLSSGVIAETFGDAIFRFGRLAGECFAAVQNGPFASEEIERLVNSIREFGVPGAGQSSWGPTVFAVTDGDQQARQLVDWVRGRSAGAEYEIVIARPNNRGAQIEVVGCGTTERAG